MARLPSKRDQCKTASTFVESILTWRLTPPVVGENATCQLVDVLDHRHTYINIIDMVHRYRFILTNYTCRDEYRITTVAISIEADADHLCDQA